MNPNGNDPPPADPAADEDELWLRALRGEAVDPAAPAVREARLLQLALLEEDAALERDAQLQAALSDSARELRWQQLRFKLDQRPPTNARSASRPWLAWTGLAAAAALATAVMLPMLNQDQLLYPQPPVWRGAYDAQQHVKVVVERPRHAAEQLATLLQQQQVWHAIYQRAEVFIVDLDLQEPPSPELQQQLQQWGLSTSQGVRRVEFGTTHP